MSNSPTKQQQENLRALYSATLAFINGELEEAYRKKECHALTEMLSEVFLLESLIENITREQYEFLVKSMNEYLEHQYAVLKEKYSHDNT